MSNLYVLAGTQAGTVFELRDGANSIGRSPENDIRIADRTVSRRHLKITRRGDKYFITDLESQNRTFFDGNYLKPGIEVELKEGIPIAIGMSVICIGEGCKNGAMPFLDLTQPPFTREISDPKSIYGDRRKKNNTKELEVFYKISDVLMAHLPVKETLQQILDYILELLKRIERAGFILLDPKGGGIGEIIFRSRKLSDDTSGILFHDVLNRVIEKRRPLVVA
ncbi:MAG: FHA domain-containing protein, partial [Desulfobacterales bacterium]|nr:FHA domain-containing protein [Desulfobacterales bacterium]